ncbi:hypothetical protein [Streptomyces sp. Da 82-17]|uniref:hypothetical protein n=1 Tax=Streptomyces sp. Da 82-17 TaxID=3377116 RepID=UPI0038D36ECE
MAEANEQLPQHVGDLSSGAYRPRLGDLALDEAAGHRVGVVIATPNETVKTFHLRTPGGGRDWRAKGDGSTLTPVHAPVSHATLSLGELRIDGVNGTTTFPITLHHVDGGTSDSFLIIADGRGERSCAYCPEPSPTVCVRVVQSGSGADRPVYAHRACAAARGIAPLYEVTSSPRLGAEHSG